MESACRSSRKPFLRRPRSRSWTCAQCQGSASVALGTLEVRYYLQRRGANKTQLGRLKARSKAPWVAPDRSCNGLPHRLRRCCRAPSARARGSAEGNRNGTVRLKKEQESWWKGLKKTEPDPHIFRKFIDSDRNLLLKEAELTVTQGIHVVMQEVACASDSFSAHLSGQEPSQPEQRSPPCSTHSDPSPTSYSYHMKSGFFVGQDSRDLVREAVEWWEKQLSDIEQKAATSSS
jgi:hypothetical protein